MPKNIFCVLIVLIFGVSLSDQSLALGQPVTFIVYINDYWLDTGALM